MSRLSFHFVSAPGLFPGGRARKQLLWSALAAAALAGCGGGEPAPESVMVRGPDFSFEAPGDWDVERTARAVTAADGDAKVGVLTFRLVRPYTPALWSRVVPELDALARRLAGELDAEVAAKSTVTIDGRRARSFELENAKDGTRRLAFVLRGRREYELVCRYPDADDETAAAACDRLFGSFRLA
jgi:hypothetical protein